MNANKQDAGGLLPCPFCGGAGKYHTKSGSYGYYPPAVQAGCSLCSVRTPGSDIDDSGRGDYPTQDKAYKIAADNWNRRNGEQSRAASGESVEVEELIGRLYAAARHVDLAAKKQPDAFNGWEARDIVSAIEKLRALSRGVPEGK